MMMLLENLGPPANILFDDILSCILFVGEHICEWDISLQNICQQPTSVQDMFVFQQ